MLRLYNSFFNPVLESGILPDSWLEDIIKPIYKNKGDPLQSENYRPITILSCFGKLFTSMLNSRLHKFLEHHNILDKNQAGFRPGYSSTDHIFVLHAVTEVHVLKSKKVKLFCSFIDFSKAFDSVWRVGLWTKFLKHNIKGNFFRIIYNMYQEIKSCVSFNGSESSFFQSYRGVHVRQGENLSPDLFALFLNDLENFLSENNLKLSDDDLSTYTQCIKTFALLYADDTLIFGTDEVSFQNNLNAFFEYSQIWKLDINFDKTKILVFGARNDDRFNFKLGVNTIATCNDFNYLGVIFTKSRSFYKARKNNVDHARKALHLLYKRTRNLYLPLDLQLHLFDHTVLPIALYSCEVWGLENIQLIEHLHNEFLRRITNLRRSTPIYMLYAELWRTPVEIYIKSQLIGFWLSLVNGKETKLSKILYKKMLHDYNAGIYEHKWIRYIRDIHVSVGRFDLFHKNDIDNHRSVKMSISRVLFELHIQEWVQNLDAASKGNFYSSFKQDLAFQNYLQKLDSKHYLPVIKFRTSNHKLPVETGRWENIPLDERNCQLHVCTKTDIGD